MRSNNFCRICSSNEIKFETLVSMGKIPRISTKGQLLELMICPACGHASRNDGRDLTTNLEIQQNSFNQNVVMPHRRESCWPHRPALIASEIRRLHKQAGKALDIGCNTGIWLAALGTAWDRYGVELSPLAAETARLFSKAEIYCGSIESYQAAPNSYDMVTAFAVIEHLSDPQMLVAWAYEHLAPGGLLVLMTGDRESLVARQMGTDWPLYWSHDHISFFSARSLCRLLENQGFRVIRQEWRFMYTATGLGSPMRNYFMKLKEILRIGITSPTNDHYYCYARKLM
jgi:2-polyprenyl-3-methyl-5-hydroxy-6-metoxy-1,4-benzoquinol methylase